MQIVHHCAFARAVGARDRNQLSIGGQGSKVEREFVEAHAVANAGEAFEIELFRGHGGFLSSIGCS